MIRFAYTGRDSSGESVSGVLEAESQQEAYRKLRADGLSVSSIAPERANIDDEALKLKHSASQVGREDVISFAAQMSVMLETGVPLAEAMDAVAETGRGPGHLPRVLQELNRRITGGETFSSAVLAFPKVFPPLMVSLIRAAEASGTLGPMLARVAAYLDKDRKTVRQIRGALTYPMIMVGLATVITGFLVTWVLPRFARIYESREAALPKPTKFVLGISDFIQTNWVVLLIAIAAIPSAYFLARSSDAGRRLIDTIKIKAPVVGPMLNSFYLSRSVRTLGTLLASGVPLLDAVGITRGVTANSKWTDLWDESLRTMTAGKPISDVLSKSELIPPTTARMIAAGERTGKLPEVLERVADTVEDDLDTAIKSATQLIEPAMIIFMGGTIGGIAIALLLPVFSIASTVSS